MHSRPITYKDFDGEEVTETFYFNISKTEIIELEASERGGFTAWIQNMIKTEDLPSLMAQFKRMILLSYGEKSADGKHFIKSDEARELFSYSAAYDALFMEIFGDETKMAEFITAIVPVEARERLAEEVTKTKEAVATGPQPPVPPVPPQT